MNKKSIKKISFTLLAVLMLTLTFPLISIAAPDDPEESVNITMEYRYAEGEAISIPPTITQLGREYKLLSQNEPVLESTLPQTRTYSYRIDGALSEDDYGLVKDLANTTITTVNVPVEREVDKTVVLSLPNNDIENIPMTRTFEVSSAETGTAPATLERAGVTFDIVKDSTGYPTSYSATVVYRGIETYEDFGYYIVDTTVERVENIGNTNQYVIVATYEPVDPPVVPTELPVNNDNNDNTVTNPPQDIEPISEFTQEEQIMIDNQTGNPLTDIRENNVPLGSGAVKSAWSVLSFLIAAVALIFSIALIIAAFLGRKKKIEKYVDYDNKKNIRIVLRIATILLGISIVPLWYILDNITLPIVWINVYTSMIGLVFAIQIICFAVYSFVSRSKKIEIEEPVK